MCEEEKDCSPESWKLPGSYCHVGARAHPRTHTRTHRSAPLHFWDQQTPPFLLPWKEGAQPSVFPVK